jgi:putative endonuclease
MKSYFVYILASKKNGTLYIGVTDNLVKRVWQHKNKVTEGRSIPLKNATDGKMIV